MPPTPRSRNRNSNHYCTERLPGISASCVTCESLPSPHSGLFTISFTGSLHYFELFCTSLFISCLSDIWRKVPFRGSVFLHVREIGATFPFLPSSLCDPETHKCMCSSHAPCVSRRRADKGKFISQSLVWAREGESPLMVAYGNCSPLFVLHS